MWFQWFGKIETGDDAQRLIKTTSTVYFVLSSMQAAVGIILISSKADILADKPAYFPLSADPFELLFTSALIAFFAILLRYGSSRFAAVMLLTISISIFVTGFVARLGTTHGGPNILFAMIAVWAGVRATEATFKLRGRFAEAGNRNNGKERAGPQNEGQTSQSAGANPNSQKPFDVEKWNALLKYDLDIAKVADQLRPFGNKWVDVFARDYLVLNDKQYLSQIVQRIIDDARGEIDAKKQFDENPNTVPKNEYEHNDTATANDSEERPRFRYEPLKPGKSRNYIARHWRGELSLPVSYWVNGFLGNVVAIVAVIAITRGFHSKEEFDPSVALLALALSWIVISAIASWQYVGNWRSATNYQQTKKFWGGITKVVIVISAAGSVFVFGQSGFPQLQELTRIYQGDAHMGTHAFAVIREGKGLRFTGGITFGVAKEFEGFLKAMPNVKLVLLDSGGGRAKEAARIGDLIKGRGLDTRVARQCMSACTTIFLSGRERTISSKAKLGFHQPDFPGLTDDQRAAIILAEKKRLQQQGVTLEFAEKAVSASPADMWFPTTAELLAGRVVTQVADLSPLGPPTDGVGRNTTRSPAAQAAPLDYSSLSEPTEQPAPVNPAPQPSQMADNAPADPTGTLPPAVAAAIGASVPGYAAQANSARDPSKFVVRAPGQPSFDCAKAVQPIEHIICADADLTSWDGRLGASFKKRAARLDPVFRAALLKNQNDWLKLRNYKCDIPTTWTETDVALVKSCLVLATANRIEAIDAGVVP